MTARDDNACLYTAGRRPLTSPLPYILQDNLSGNRPNGLVYFPCSHIYLSEMIKFIFSNLSTYNSENTSRLLLDVSIFCNTRLSLIYTLAKNCDAFVYFGSLNCYVSGSTAHARIQWRSFLYFRKRRIKSFTFIFFYSYYFSFRFSALSRIQCDFI